MEVQDINKARKTAVSVEYLSFVDGNRDFFPLAWSAVSVKTVEYYHALLKHANHV